MILILFFFFFIDNPFLYICFLFFLPNNSTCDIQSYVTHNSKTCSKSAKKKKKSNEMQASFLSVETRDFLPFPPLKSPEYALFLLQRMVWDLSSWARNVCYENKQTVKLTLYRAIFNTKDRQKKLYDCVTQNCEISCPCPLRFMQITLSHLFIIIGLRPKRSTCKFFKWSWTVAPFVLWLTWYAILTK